MPDDFPNKRLSEVKPQAIGFNCNSCYRHAVVDWWELYRRFPGDPVLTEIALTLAKSTTGNPCRQPDHCLARPLEMPVDTWATLDHAYRGRWRVQLECGRRHEGLKAAKSCPRLFELDVRTLYALLGRDYRIDRLRPRCPGCGSTLVHLIWTVPPPPPPPKEEVRRMPDGRPVGVDEEAVAFNTRRAMRGA